MPSIILVKTPHCKFVREFGPHKTARLKRKRLAPVLRTLRLWEFCSRWLVLCQNVGTRELHWSAGVLQLGATIIVSAFCGLLRRNIGEEAPSRKPLSPGFEASHLTCELEELIGGLMSDAYPGSEIPRASEHSSGPFPLRLGQFDKNTIGDILWRPIPPPDPSKAQTSLDEQCRNVILKGDQLLELRSELSSFEPDGDNVTEFVSRICSAINAILLTLDIPHKFTRHQLECRKAPKTRGNLLLFSEARE
jgi:hypothetical protein